MINPNLEAKDRIHSELPEDIKNLMEKYVLTKQEHDDILEDIKKDSYYGKSKVKNPKFIIVLGQTGSGKSNLTAKIISDNPNIVAIDSDKYKEYRPDSQEILRDHLVEYAFLTAPDAYQHRDEMICDAMDKRYNILMECATSEKEGMFVDLDKIQQAGYEVELAVLGVGQLNSMLSVHERYEAQILLNYPAAKLTRLNRHDDSYSSLAKSIKNTQDENIKIMIYERGKNFPFVPEKVYSSTDECQRFQTAVEALEFTRNKDNKETMKNFNERYMSILGQMFHRNAPEQQVQQLESIRSRYKEIEDNNMER